MGGVLFFFFGAAFFCCFCSSLSLWRQSRGDSRRTGGTLVVALGEGGMLDFVTFN